MKSVSDKTREAIRQAFYGRGVIDIEKQHAFAERLGFNLAPSENAVTTLPSFLNLSEDDAQRLLATVYAPFFCERCHEARSADRVPRGICSDCGSVVRSTGSLLLSTKEN